ncbi:MAG: DUF1599 domain-containing protein [Muribaculaceae bacterium]|nr:DUF1599 domain-containing protein [Muribaculaceae bacterium]
MDTTAEFTEALAGCRRIFAAKLGDYGPSWRLLRPESVTDQLFIKAKRIRSLQIKGETKVGDGIRGEFEALVNYSFVGVIQCRLGFVDTKDLNSEQALKEYDRVSDEARELMLKKNHDYDEAWRGMRVSSYVDFILTKIERIKEIEEHSGRTAVSEGIESNYLDIANYAVFGVIKCMEDGIK